MKILLVDDDQAFVARLRSVLTQAHYQVDVAFTGQQGLELLEFSSYELLLLDLRLPDRDGVQVCQRLRSRRDATPILLLTASEAQATKVRALDAGADDYLVKPFDTQELLARIRALLRRQAADASPILRWGTLELDPSLAQVSCGKAPLSVTAKEYELLELLLRNPQRIFSAQALLDRLWLLEDAPLETAIRTHIKELRRKLKAAGEPDMIETVRGLGYRLREAPPPALDEFDTVLPEIPATKGLVADLTAVWKVAQRDYLARLDRMNLALAGYDGASEVSPEACKQARATLRREAHTLKGGLASFGLGGLSDLSRDIQHQAETCTDDIADWLSIQLLVAQLREQLLNADQLTEEMMEAMGYGRLNVSHATQSAPGGSALEDMPEATAEASQNSRDLVSSCHWLVTADDSLRDRLLAELDQALPQTPDQSPDASDSSIVLRPHPPMVEDLTDPGKLNTSHIIWFDLASSPHWPQANDCLQLARRLPHVGVLALAANADLETRLDACLKGGDRFGLRSAATEALWAIATDLMANRPSSPLRLLVVDDDPGCLLRLERDLRPFSPAIVLETLSEPERFWDVLEQTQPDALVLDAEMPEFSGFELCQVVRTDPTWRRLPILFWSGYGDTATLQQLFEAQVNDFLIKPVEGKTLIRRVLACVDRVSLAS